MHRQVLAGKNIVKVHFSQQTTFQGRASHLLLPVQHRFYDMPIVVTDEQVQGKWHNADRVMKRNLRTSLLALFPDVISSRVKQQAWWSNSGFRYASAASKLAHNVQLRRKIPAAFFLSRHCSDSVVSPSGAEAPLVNSAWNSLRFTPASMMEEPAAAVPAELIRAGTWA